MSVRVTLAKKKGRHLQQLQVTLNGQSLGSFSPTDRIIVTGLSGNDDIRIGAGINIPSMLIGGEGNDVLLASAGNSILVGQGGEDRLTGGNGRDILIGGFDADVLNGAGGDDILIAGFAENSSLFELSLLMREWARTDQTYQFRVDHIRFGDGLNGNVTLNAGSVIDDGATDVLTGGGGRDWFFYDFDGPSPDTLKDPKRDELQSEVDFFF